MWTIIPDYYNTNIELESKLQLCRINGCYLHGELQSDANTDLFNLIKDEIDIDFIDNDKYYLDSKKLEDGIYPCKYNNKECSFYYWKHKDKYSRGLVIYNEDINELQYVKNCYENKVHAI
jgi:hypothetical protein